MIYFVFENYLEVMKAMGLLLIVSWVLHLLVSKKHNLKRKIEKQLIVDPEIVDPEIVVEEEKEQLPAPGTILNYSGVTSQLNDSQNSSYSLRPRRELKRPKRFSNDFVYH